MPRPHSRSWSDEELRHRIACEAARLIARGKAKNIHTARMRAMRWLSQQKLSSAAVPSQEEIMLQLEFLHQPLETSEEELDFSELADDSGSEADHQASQWRIQFQPLLEQLRHYYWRRPDHPEGDALYHSLQVYQLGKELAPYDEEFQWACLLHDIGYAVEPRTAQAAGLRVLQGRVTDRIYDLIHHLEEAHRFLAGETRAQSLRKHPDFPLMIDLARCDLQGRIAGQDVCTLDEAFDELELLERSSDDPHLN